MSKVLYGVEISLMDYDEEDLRHLEVFEKKSDADKFYDALHAGDDRVIAKQFFGNEDQFYCVGLKVGTVVVNTTDEELEVLMDKIKVKENNNK